LGRLPPTVASLAAAPRRAVEVACVSAILNGADFVVRR
jgi:hypothetical protein